jgi:hypothetical protein
MSPQAGDSVSCAFLPCHEVTGGMGCCLPKGCVLARFGPAPKAKPPAPLRRFQPPQERLFGQAVSRGRRKGRKARGRP